jgi:hypothetical protein
VLLGAARCSEHWRGCNQENGRDFDETKKTGEILKKPRNKKTWGEDQANVGNTTESMKGIVVHPEWTGGWAHLNHTKSRKQTSETHPGRKVIEVGQESKCLTE